MDQSADSGNSAVVGKPDDKLNTGFGEPIATGDRLKDGTGGVKGVTGFADPSLLRTTSGNTGPIPSRSGDIAGANPASIPAGGDFNLDEPIKPKRGRPLGGTNRSKSSPQAEASRSVAPKNKEFDLNGVEQILIFVHGVAATTFNNPVMDITESEAKRLSKALSRVNDAFEIPISKQTGALMELGGVAYAIYWPKAKVLFNSKSARPNVSPTRPAQPQPQHQPRPQPSARPEHMNGAVSDRIEQPTGKMPEGFDPTSIKVMN